jgi:hypothetical protein
MNHQRGTSKEVRRHTHGESADLSDCYLPIRRSFRTPADRFLRRIFKALTHEKDEAVRVEITREAGKTVLTVREI